MQTVKMQIGHIGAARSCTNLIGLDWEVVYVVQPDRASRQHTNHGRDSVAVVHKCVVSTGLVVSGHVHQFRDSWPGGQHHVWGPSTGFVIPDRVQPYYGLKEVGWVEHRLEPDGTHQCRLVVVPGVPTLNIADFPQVYGPI